MAIEDYFIDLYYVERVRQPDGTGGFEYVYKIGDAFRGSATKASTSEQTVAGVRGDISEQYTITTHNNNILELSDILMFVNEDNKRIFLRVNSEPSNLSTLLSKSMSSVLYIPVSALYFTNPLSTGCSSNCIFPPVEITSFSIFPESVFCSINSPCNILFTPY